jgi:hypothetical protein
MQVAIVKGLNRKLEGSVKRKPEEIATYAAAIAKLFQRLSFLGDVNSFAEPASPESAIVMRAFALSKSTSMYSK